MLERDGLAHLLDARVYTSDLAVTKPHPDAFRAALDSVQVSDPSRAVYVGDRLFDDIFGAQRAGMRTIHRPNAHVPSYDVTPDASIDRLAEILPIVEAWDARR
jgi:putative hydrolase of the HAD superfamily